MSSRVKIKKVEDLEPTPLVPPAQDAETAAEEQTPPPAAPVPDKVTRSEGLRIIMNNPENTVVIRHLIVTTVLMFTLPFAAFYGFKYLDYAGFPTLHLYFRDRDVVGAIGALVVIQMLIVRFVWTALTEKDERSEAFTEKKNQ